MPALSGLAGELAKRLEANFNFDLASKGAELDENSAFFDYVKTALSERIVFLINTDMDKLLQALYRIDVNDRETDRAFALGEIKLVAERIAELVIRRQLRKLEYSRHFHADNVRSGRGKDDDDEV